jgi:DNA-directed RNA polymerase specialized sigma subunit
MKYAEKLKKFEDCRKTCKELESGNICPCLEAVLPRDQNQSVGVILSDRIEETAIEEKQVKKKPKSFIKKMKRYGLDKYRAKVMMLRFVYGLSFQQIADELKITNKWVIFNAYKSALHTLKENGYKK